MAKPFEAEQHNILVCADCKSGAKLGELQNKLQLDLPNGYSLHKIKCMAGCDRPTTVGFQSLGKASYLFGDIESSDDISALIEFASQYKEIEDGWSSASDRPIGLLTKTIARIPAIKHPELP